MTGKTTYLKTEDFRQRGNFNRFDSECRIDNLVFRKGDTLPQQDIQQVLDICNKYNKFDINTLIIKSGDNLTIWIEEKSQRSICDQNNTQSSTTQVSQPSLPTKTVTKRYRGQVYEETVVDWAAIQQVGNQNKPRRKYRGQYVD